MGTDERRRLDADTVARERMPIRGLATDLAWERAQIPVLWGTWTREGSRVTVIRGATLDGTYVREDFRIPTRRD